MISFGGVNSQRYITSYFRHEFDASDTAASTRCTLELLRDDGAVVYLNGTEIARIEHARRNDRLR